jgi:2-iminoacetate synthase ThiH
MKIMFNYLEIETCSLCNRTCPWCLFGQLPNFRGDQLQFLDTFYIEKILSELNQNRFKGVISLYSMNEPLLDERIKNGYLFQLCRNILTDTDVKIKINTNLLYLISFPIRY